MTRTTNSRLAGVMFLLYIATGVADMILLKPANAGESTAARLASLARHADLARLASLFSLGMMMDAFILAVALYALTRDYDRDLALLALCCRIAEGLLGSVNAVVNRVLLNIALTGGTDTAAANVVAGALMKAQGFNTLFCATAFAIGSTIFAYLFLRARTIPALLAWLGLIGSLVLVAGLPLQMLQLIGGSVANLMWIPIALFEVTFAVWLLIKGVAAQPVPATAIAH